MWHIHGMISMKYSLLPKVFTNWHGNKLKLYKYTLPMYFFEPTTSFFAILPCSKLSTNFDKVHDCCETITKFWCGHVKKKRQDAWSQQKHASFTKAEHKIPWWSPLRQSQLLKQEVLSDMHSSPLCELSMPFALASFYQPLSAPAWSWTAASQIVGACLPVGCWSCSGTPDWSMPLPLLAQKWWSCWTDPA